MARATGILAKREARRPPLHLGGNGCPVLANIALPATPEFPPMTISMYDASIPVLSRALNNLAAILDKAAAHAEAKKIDPAVLLQSRLFPDMFALTRQVQIAADMAKAGGSRLAGIQPPSFEDNEQTFAELIERLRKTVAHLETIRPEQVNGSEERTITWPTKLGERSLPGQLYLVAWILPNLYFHVATAYNILRHNGVELGKADFLGKLF
jgi:hypothetical protein